MARKPSEPTAEKTWTPDSIRVAMKRLGRRFADVEAFQPQKVENRRDPQLQALEAAIRATLADVFEPQSRTYRNYQAAASLDTAAINMNGTPHHKVIEGLVHGKARSIELLRGAIRWLEEKMEDDFPGEPLDRVALSARMMIASSGGANPSTDGGIQRAHAEGKAGTIRASIQNDTPMGAVIVAESPFEVLAGRVALLETLLNELRREIDVSTPKDVGIGHNRGPEFAPVPIEDLNDVAELIALLKDQGPNPPTDRTHLVEQSEKASILSAKINEALGVVGSELAKGVAREGGRQMLIPLWTAFSHGIDLVILALRNWIGL